MQSKHLIKLIMMVGIVNSRQDSPPDFLIGLIDKFDHPTGRINIQGLDFDDLFVNQDHLTGRIQCVESSLISLIFAKLGTNTNHYIYLKK